MRRKQLPQIIKDLNKKMVFITGPRQAGKTWLAKEVIKHFSDAVYQHLFWLRFALITKDNIKNSQNAYGSL